MHACPALPLLLSVLCGVSQRKVRMMDGHERRGLFRHSLHWPAWMVLRERGVCTSLPKLAPLEPQGHQRLKSLPDTMLWSSVTITDGEWMDVWMSGLTDGWRKVLVYVCMCSVCVLHWELQSLSPYLSSPGPQPGLPLSLSVSPVKPSQT